MARAIKSIDVNGAKLGYSIHGAGWSKSPLIFLHGGLLRSTGGLYDELLDALGRAFSVYALDLRGHGASSAAVEGWSLAAIADDVAAFARALKLERPALVGHSLGAFTCLNASLRHREAFSAMCLLAPGPADPREDPVDALNFLIANRSNREITHAACRHMFQRAPIDILEQAVDALSLVDADVLHALRDQNAQTSISAHLGNVDTPVLLICGENDNVIAPTRQHDIARQLRRCKEVVYSTEGHMFPNENAAMTAREIIGFLTNDAPSMAAFALPIPRQSADVAMANPDANNAEHPLEHSDCDLEFKCVRALLDDVVSSGKLPCASVLVHQRGREILYHQVGFKDVESAEPVARDTIFRLFSMTKPITTAALMALVDDGAVTLEDEITKFIPEFVDLQVFKTREDDATRTERATPISIKQLLTHTAGFSYWFYPNLEVGALYAASPGIGIHERWRFDPALDGLDGLARSLARLPLVAQPGERWHYSMSLDVAGIVIQRASGLPLETFMRQRIFEPLGMRDTGFSVGAHAAERLSSLYGPKSPFVDIAHADDGQGVAGIASLDARGNEHGMALLESATTSPLLKDIPGAAGGGGLVSTIDDYARFAQMLLQDGALNEVRVLSAKATQRMMSSQVEPARLGELPGLAALGLGGSGDGLGFGLGGAVVLRPPSNGVPAFEGEYSWGGGASTTFWVDPKHQLSVVFMTQYQPPSAEMLRDKLHAAIYKDLGLRG